MSDIGRLPEPDRPKPPEVVFIDVNFDSKVHLQTYQSHVLKINIRLFPTLNQWRLV